MLNPALTFALYLADGKYKENAFTAGLIIGAQVTGAFLGLEFALLLRFIYPSGAGYLAVPAFLNHLPGI